MSLAKPLQLLCHSQSAKIRAMESFACNRKLLAAMPTWLGAVFITLTLTLPPTGKTQLLMNLAPQTLPHSSVGPTYDSTLSAVKKRINTSATQSSQSNPQPDPAPAAVRRQVSGPITAAPVSEVCGLTVSQMNDIRKHKLVKVSVGPCLMVFNAND
jgi:hypothetical protein